MTNVGQIGVANYGAYTPSYTTKIVPFKGESTPPQAQSQPQKEESHTTRNILLGLGTLVAAGLVWKFFKNKNAAKDIEKTGEKLVEEVKGKPTTVSTANVDPAPTVPVAPKIDPVPATPVTVAHKAVPVNPVSAEPVKTCVAKAETKVKKEGINWEVLPKNKKGLVERDRDGKVVSITFQLPQNGAKTITDPVEIERLLMNAKARKAAAKSNVVAVKPEIATPKTEEVIDDVAEAVKRNNAKSDAAFKQECQIGNRISPDVAEKLKQFK